METVEETTAAGQVRFRWWMTADGLGIHNISDQQLRNDYTLDTSLAYASAIAGDTERVLLEQGGGTEHQAFYLLDLHTKAVEPLPTGTDAPLRDAIWNGTATRVLLRLRDGGFYLGDGSTAASLQEMMQLDAPLVRAQWLGADQPDRLLCITQADPARCSAWVYDCAAETTTLLLEDYAEYMGNNDETTQYELLSDAYALRRDPRRLCLAGGSGAEDRAAVVGLLLGRRGIFRHDPGHGEIRRPRRVGHDGPWLPGLQRRRVPVVPTEPQSRTGRGIRPPVPP